MFGSIFVGLSGMNAFSNGLRQISNNITNINSTGFKSARLLFSGVFGGDQGARTGEGRGVTMSKATLDFAQGELRQTDRDLDLAIEGAGFLVLLKDADRFFARTGSFEVNQDGDIVLAGTEYKLTVLDASGKPTAISVDAKRTSPPQATTKIQLADNLSSTATTFSLSNLEVFNAQGAGKNWQVRFERSSSSPAGEWAIIVTDGAGAEIGRQTLKFINGVVDPVTSQLTFSDTDGRSVILDLSRNVTSFSSGEVSTLRVADIDGRAAGELATVRVNDTGVLEFAYSNEDKQTIGAVTIAVLRDQQVLDQREGGLFMHDGLVGIDFLTSAHETAGRVVSRRIEASNVDLSREFGDLILVQRGFQASSQVVSVSNDMIQQLFGIRGQG